ncbi:MAG: hypothetical protein AB2A00_05095 [Myxococcota bacterium]
MTKAALGFTLTALTLLDASTARATCASVKIEILQEVTFERQAFDARMEITNGLAESISGIRVDISVADETGANRGNEFFIRLDSQEGLSGAPDGSGSVAANGKADIHWLMIPSFGAGGTTPAGANFLVGATLTYTVAGKTQTVEVVPDAINVQPMPLLTLDYFEPEYVNGDDPYTPQQEAPEPYTLGVRVKNHGYGPARKLKIQSAQPRIVENQLGLLVDFRILATEVSGVTTQNSLLADFGDLPNDEARNARWIMVSTLSGRFIEFNVSFTHDDNLGGELTSLIEATNAHYLIHDVLVDLPGRDTVKDFLATVTNTPSTDLIVYESDNVETVVLSYGEGQPGVAQLDRSPTVDNPHVTLTASVVIGGPSYIRVTDPMAGTRRLVGATRSDGKVINEANVWLSKEYIPATHSYRYGLNLFDIESTGAYTVTYEMVPVPDFSPPETRIEVAEPKTLTGTPVCVTRKTNHIFVAQDAEGPVPNLFMQIDGNASDLGAYFAAINPFRFELRPSVTEGQHRIHYYGRDLAGNDEPPRFLDVIVDDNPPIVQTVYADPPQFTPGEDEALASNTTRLSYRVDDVCGPVYAQLEIAAGTGEFSGLPVVAHRTGIATPGTTSAVTWDGRDDFGGLVAPGTYSVHVTFRDGIYDQVATEDRPAHERISPVFTVQVKAARQSEPVDPLASANQQSPSIHGDDVVWADDRTGRWQIRHEDVLSGSATFIAPFASDQTSPVISTEHIAWVDNRNGDLDVVIHDRLTLATTVLAQPGDQTNPSLSDDWLVYESNINGNIDIYAYSLTTGTTTQVTSHERDQVKPRAAGSSVVWEDYRHGRAEVYAMDLSTTTETRITVLPESDQLNPVVTNEVIVWVDNRHGGETLYAYDRSTQRVTRLTYGSDLVNDPDAIDGRYVAIATGAEAQGDLLVGDPLAGTGTNWERNASDQRHARVHGDKLVWQELVDGFWQVKWSEVTLPDLTLAFRQGYNLLALPESVALEHLTAHALLTAWQQQFGVVGVRQLDSSLQTFKSAWIENGSPMGDDFPLEGNQTLVVESDGEGILEVDGLGPRPAVDLVAGANGLGLASFPYGLRAWDVVSSLGEANVVSLQRFNRRTGAFETAAVNNAELLGPNFNLRSGEGLWVTMAQPVAGWRP